MVDFKRFFKFSLLISTDCFDFFLLNRKSFLGFLIDFEKKLWFLGWFQKNFSVFWLIFKGLLGFFVPFREKFWCLGAPFRSFENDTVAPFKTIRLHLHETNIFYPSSDDEYGGPCHRESLYSSAHALHKFSLVYVCSHSCAHQSFTDDVPQMQSIINHNYSP